MHLTVSHVSRYTYSQPVRFFVQSLKLRPSPSQSQQPVAWDVSAPGCYISEPFVDGYGDLVQTLSRPEDGSEVEISVVGEITTTDTGGVLRGHAESISPLVFLRTTEVTRPGDEMELLAHSVGASTSNLDLAHKLADAVSDAVAYVPGATHAHTTANDALRRAQGVCQDHAHVLIAAARLRGLPARYVSGYLCMEEAGEQHEASHGWAELYIEDIGWIGFDPSNQVCPTEYYIRLGSGLDARDGAPIRGVHAGEAEEALQVNVVIQQTQQQ